MNVKCRNKRRRSKKKKKITTFYLHSALGTRFSLCFWPKCNLCFVTADKRNGGKDNEREHIQRFTFGWNGRRKKKITTTTTANDWRANRREVLTFKPNAIICIAFFEVPSISKTLKSWDFFLFYSVPLLCVYVFCYYSFIVLWLFLFSLRINEQQIIITNVKYGVWHIANGWN